jgi:hypothetical protein
LDIFQERIFLVCQSIIAHKYIIPLSYAIESDKNNCFDLYFGIEKWDEDEGIPFKGNWERVKIPNNWKDIFFKIKQNLLLSKLSRGWEVGNWWIVGKYFADYYKGMWQKEFYIEIIEKGYDYVVNYYFDELLNLKSNTEDLIDRFMEMYKNYG